MNLNNTTAILSNQNNTLNNGNINGSINGNNRLVPSIKVKTNEFFYKWFSSKERTEQLKEAINFIKSTNKIPKLTDLESYKNVI
jgi:hypothetical protein